MTVSQKETSLVRLMVYAREHKYASRTLRAAEPATPLSAKNSWSGGPKKRATLKSTIKWRGETITMTALESTLNAAMLVTARDQIRCALRMRMETATAINPCVRTFKLQWKKSTGESPQKIQGLNQVTKRSRSSRSISRKMTSLSTKIADASRRATPASPITLAKMEKFASMIVLTRDSATLDSVLMFFKSSTTKRVRRRTKRAWLQRKLMNALRKRFSVEKLLTARETKFAYSTIPPRDTASLGIVLISSWNEPILKQKNQFKTSFALS